MNGPCLCGDPGCGSCFANPEPGDNEVVLVELPGGEVIQCRYGELPDYGEPFSWGEEEPPVELEEALAEIDDHGEMLFYRLYNDDRGTVAESLPGFIFEEKDRFAFPPDGAALATEVYLVCSGFVEGHSVEAVFLDPDLAFAEAEKVAERESEFFKERYVRTRDGATMDKEIAVWSRRDGRFGGPNRLIGYVSIERHPIRRRERGGTQVEDPSRGDAQGD